MIMVLTTHTPIHPRPLGHPIQVSHIPWAYQSSLSRGVDCSSNHSNKGPVEHHEPHTAGTAATSNPSNPPFALHSSRTLI